MIATENLDGAGEMISPVAGGTADADTPSAEWPRCPAAPASLDSPDAKITMVVRDPAMRSLMDRAALAATSNANILIAGESGSGKDLIAARIHHASAARARPLIVLNCAALPEFLLDRAAFGAPKGGHTGVPCQQSGQAASGSGGTLLLDEIGEMDLTMQAKLLWILQRLEMGRARGEKLPRDELRIIATTSKNLQEEVRLGRFRAALFFRINVVTLNIPPLRDRPADIVALANFFAASQAEASGASARCVSPEGLALLARHTWPGNVRELESVMHRAALATTGPIITPSSLDIGAAEMPDTRVALPVDRLAGQSAVATSGRTIEAVEKDMILETLRQCRGNRGQTASVLGISVRTLRNKLHEYERLGTRIPRPVIIAIA